MTLVAWLCGVALAQAVTDPWAGSYQAAAPGWTQGHTLDLGLPDDLGARVGTLSTWAMAEGGGSPAFLSLPVVGTSCSRIPSTEAPCGGGDPALLRVFAAPGARLPAVALPQGAEPLFTLNQTPRGLETERGAFGEFAFERRPPVDWAATAVPLAEPWLDWRGVIGDGVVLVALPGLLSVAYPQGGDVTAIGRAWLDRAARPGWTETWRQVDGTLIAGIYQRGGRTLTVAAAVDRVGMPVVSVTLVEAPPDR